MGRDLDRGDSEAVEEVFAEAALFGGGPEVDVAGGDEADVGAASARVAEATVLLLLDEAEEGDLIARGEGVDFVEEESSAFGFGDETVGSVAGSGEGSADVAEELVLDEVGGDGSAVDGDERTRGAEAGVVGVAGVELFACSAWAGDQDLELGRGEAAKVVEDPAVRLAAPGPWLGTHPWLGAH
jgi:hypothetical protein